MNIAYTKLRYMQSRMNRCKSIAYTYDKIRFKSFNIQVSKSFQRKFDNPFSIESCDRFNQLSRDKR